MARNRVQTKITEEQIQRVKDALYVLENTFPDFVTLEAEDRRSTRGMTTRFEQFCRQTLVVAQENPKLIPETLNVQHAVEDLDAYDKLLPLHTRLKAVMTRWDDTLLSLGADVMETSSDIYLLLKAFGKAMGLEAMRKGLGSLFRKTKPKLDKAAEQ